MRGLVSRMLVSLSLSTSVPLVLIGVLFCMQAVSVLGLN